MVPIEIASDGYMPGSPAQLSKARTARTVEKKTVRLGFACSALLLAAYGGFVLLAAFAPQVLARPLLGGPQTVAFGYGLGVIAMGVALTCLYALAARAIEARSGAEDAR